jgi:polysaccharide export outer membrane protein
MKQNTPMNKIYAVLALALIILSSSCISQKELTYLQEQEGQTDSLRVLTEVQKPYRVQINDILNVQVKALDQETTQILNPTGDANLNASSQERAYFDGFTVDLRGNIRIPILGQLQVLGLTTEEIQDLIEQRLLEEQFKDTAQIFVTVKLAGLRYTATGEVGSPGTNVLFQERVNIFEALANVGDVALTGNRKEVMIIRQYPQGQEIHYVDLTDRAVMQSPFYYIQPNDMIYVKPLKQKSWGTGTTGTQTLGTVAAVFGLVTTTILLLTRL